MKSLIFLGILWAVPNHLLAASGAANAEKIAFKKALELYESENYEAARLAFSELVKNYSRKNLYRFNLANCYFMLGQFPKSILHYDRVIKNGGAHYHASLWYRAKAIRDSGELERAEVALMEILKIKTLSKAIRKGVELDLRGLSADGDGEMAQEALDLYQRGLYRRTLSKIDEIQNPSPDIKLLKSLALTKLAREDEAKEVLKGVDLKDARDLLDHLEKEAASAKKFWGFVELTLGHNNNIWGDPPTQAPIEGHISKNYWGIGDRVAMNGPHGWIWNYYGSLESYSGARDLDVFDNKAFFGYGYQATPINFHSGLFAQLTHWGGSPAVSKWGGKIKARKTWRIYDVGGDMEYSFRKNEQTRYGYLAGQLLNSKVYVGFSHQPIYAQLFFDFGFNHTSDLLFANADLIPIRSDFFGPGIKVLWRVNDLWSMTTQYSVISHLFTTRAQPGNERRLDQETNASLRFNRVVNDHWLGYFVYSIGRNDSTLGLTSVSNKNVEDETMLLGMVWEYQ